MWSEHERLICIGKIQRFVQPQIAIIYYQNHIISAYNNVMKELNEYLNSFYTVFNDFNTFADFGVLVLLRYYIHISDIEDYGLTCKYFLK